MIPNILILFLLVLLYHFKDGKMQAQLHAREQLYREREQAFQQYCFFMWKHYVTSTQALLTSLAAPHLNQPQTVTPEPDPPGDREDEDDPPEFDIGLPPEEDD